jgi:hypothetical protein
MTISLTVIRESSNNLAKERKQEKERKTFFFFRSLCFIDKPIEVLEVTFEEIYAYFPGRFI